jgi:aspartate/methionine/tyrosine aminotransferase
VASDDSADAAFPDSMPYSISPTLDAVVEPPIPEIRAWVAGREPPPGMALIDAARAVPDRPPPGALTDHLAGRLAEPGMELYTEILGMPALRAAFAESLSRRYGGSIEPAQVGITAGGNQAFAVAMMGLAGPGDEVLLPLPYYWNHKMWLDMLGVRSVHLPFRPDRGAVPDPADAAARITSRTRAIVLVTPNNPTGAVYPPETLAAFAALARAHRVALVLDETYKDFLPPPPDESGREAGGGPLPPSAPHALLAAPDWPDTVVQIHSFSKVFGLTGYRVGAVVAGGPLMRQIGKAMDCVAICAPRVGQEAALYGLRHLDSWVAGNRAALAARLVGLRSLFAAARTPYEIVSAGAFFAYVRHPFAGRSAVDVARSLAQERFVLCLPGSAFGPEQESFLRIAVSNLDMPSIAELAARLAASGRNANRGGDVAGLLAEA